MVSSFPVRGDPQTALSSLELLRGAEQVVRTPADPHFLLAVIINPLETTISSASSESAPSPKGTLWSTQLFFFLIHPNVYMNALKWLTSWNTTVQVCCTQGLLLLLLLQIVLEVLCL